MLSSVARAKEDTGKQGREIQLNRDCEVEALDGLLTTGGDENIC